MLQLKGQWYLLQRDSSVKKIKYGLLGEFSSEAVSQGHKVVKDDQRDAKASAEGENLLANHITESGGAMGLFVHNFGHRGIGNHLAGPSNDIVIEVPNEIDRDI
jgi:hypothetical protein